MKKRGLLYFQEKGKGEKVVLLLHGFCEDYSIWQEIAEQLSQKYRVIVPDLGGFGKSAKMLPQNVTMENLGEQVKNLLSHLSIEKCIVIGHSMGGYVALALAKAYPNLFEGLGLFNSTALADSEVKKRHRHQTALFIQKNGVPAFADDFSAMMFYTKRREELQKEIEYIKKLVKQTPENSILQVILALRDRADQTEVLKALNVPVLYIIGREDQSVPLSTYEEQIFYPKNASIHILDDTAHVGMLERPKESLQMISEFLGRVWEI